MRLPALRRDDNNAPVIAHIGVGNFHRSHQAMYLDALADPDWWVLGVGVMPGDFVVRDALRAGGWTYTLALRHGDGRVESSVVSSIRDMLLVDGDGRDAVVARLADPAVRVVTLTITEGGYDPPSSAFGMLADALAARRAAGVVPFTVASCDNVSHNGAVARAALLAVVDDPSLRPWIEAEVTFPSSMVDRITPATDDPAIVYAEPFVQWVLEDNFVGGVRPALERVGVQVVADVAPYEAMKLRLLNGAHQCLAFAGLPQGHVFVHDAVADPVVTHALEAYWAEARPTVPPVPGVDLDGYLATLRQRFANRHIADTLERLAAFTIDRIPKFVLPVVADNLAAGRPVTACASVVAGWARHDARGLDLLADPVFDAVRDDRFTAAVAAAFD